MKEAEKKQGRVWLVGAGPGDTGLLTLKGRDVLLRADTVVYDALISPEILALITDGAEKINAGKRAGKHTMPQEELNRLLLEKAMEGKQVVRLKGGDPFVFGRGGEELELLAEHGIGFEIVPGVTSAAAVPAYAGIPVTHRDLTSSVHIITGHAKKDGTDRTDYDALVRMKATLVFLMGISTLPEICQRLLNAGMEKDTPAAVISKGTLAGQRCVLGKVSNIAQKVRKAELKTPAVIVIGEVCRLAGKYSWAEKRPLGGISILVTRPSERSSRMTEKLRSFGAQVMEMPTIRTERLKNNERLKEVMEEICRSRKEEWLIFTSPSGVKLFFEQLLEWKLDLRRLYSGQVRFAVIGSGTAKELAGHGIFADLIPDEYSAAALGELLAEVCKKGSRKEARGKEKIAGGNTQEVTNMESCLEKKLHIIRAKEGSEDLIEPLLREGICFEDIPLYETKYVHNEIVNEKVKEIIDNQELDFVTFTSASTVKGFVKATGLTREEMERAQFTAVCIGKKTAQEAAAYGMRLVVSPTAEIDSMIELICRMADDKLRTEDSLYY